MLLQLQMCMPVHVPYGQAGLAAVIVAAGGRVPA
jgi:hypothetical protein